MEKKKIVPIIDLDSKEFTKKVMFSLEKCGYVNTSFGGMSDRPQEIDNFVFMLMNSKSSQRKYCLACGGYHWLFSKDFELKKDADKTCLCTRCSSMGFIMAMLGVERDRIMEWMESKGQINPLELMRDGVEKMVKEGNMAVIEKRQGEE